MSLCDMKIFITEKDYFVFFMYITIVFVGALYFSDKKWEKS